MPKDQSSLSTVEDSSIKNGVAAGSDVQHIIIVDDDKDDIYLFNKALNHISDKFKLHSAISGDQLFELLDHFTPDLIFLDLRLPGKSGISCLKMVRYNKKYDLVPIIIYSNLSKRSFIQDCYEAKANYYIIKPVTFEKITIAVNKVFSNNWELLRYPSREDFLIE